MGEGKIAGFDAFVKVVKTDKDMHAVSIVWEKSKEVIKMTQLPGFGKVKAQLKDVPNYVKDVSVCYGTHAYETNVTDSSYKGLKKSLKLTAEAFELPVVNAEMTLKAGTALKMAMPGVVFPKAEVAADATIGGFK